jgi:hypothetical protein
VAYWSAHNLERIANVLPAVIGTCTVAIGTQNILGGFLLAIVSGNDAELLRAPSSAESSAAHPTVVAEREGRRASTLAVRDMAAPSAPPLDRAV